MMNCKLLGLALLFFSLLGCKESLNIEEDLSCSSKLEKRTTKITDFKKNFRLPIPNTWKVNHYYSENQSELLAADTIKQLTASYILDVSFNNGSLEFDNQFYRATDSILKSNQLSIIRSGNQEFGSRNTFWYLVTGKKNGFTYHEFNWTIQISQNSFANARTEVYGDQNVNERICKSIAILKELEFLE